jgi:hypothetical protein
VPAALAGLAIAALQLLRLKLSRSTELPVRIRLPVHAGPHGSRSGRPAKRTSIQSSSTSDR